MFIFGKGLQQNHQSLQVMFSSVTLRTACALLLCTYPVSSPRRSSAPSEPPGGLAPGMPARNCRYIGHNCTIVFGEKDYSAVIKAFHWSSISAFSDSNTSSSLLTYFSFFMITALAFSTSVML